MDDIAAKKGDKDVEMQDEGDKNEEMADDLDCLKKAEIIDGKEGTVIYIDEMKNSFKYLIDNKLLFLDQNL